MSDHRRTDGRGGWWSVLSPDASAAAIAICDDVIARLVSPERVQTAMTAARRQTRFPESCRWIRYSLAEGDAGLAVLSGYLDRCFPGQGWDITGHKQLTVATEEIERTGWPSVGLFEGLSGLAYATRTLARAGSRYQRLLATIDQMLFTQLDLIIRRTLSSERGMAVSAFDLISGLAGVGAYLLVRAEQTGELHAVNEVISALVAITRTSEDSPPRWYTPAHLLGDPDLVPLNPYGNLNCGLAHGIPGPLALMSLALSLGVTTDGLDAAVAQTANWLMGRRVQSAWGTGWPSVIPLDATGQAGSVVPSRTAWCYGTPGVARSLWLAGAALGDQRMCDVAVDAMNAVYRTPRQARGIDSPNLCHGVGGLLQITLRFAHDTRDPLFMAAAAELVDQILAAYEPDSHVAFRDVEPDGRRVDRPGLLTGACGVVAVLLSAATDVEPSWDRAFLLA